MTEWTKPDVIILGRGNPEEAVLIVCKSDTSGGPEYVPCYTPSGTLPGSGPTPCEYQTLS
jgi:hypothetical protein